MNSLDRNRIRFIFLNLQIHIHNTTLRCKRMTYVIPIEKIGNKDIKLNFEDAQLEIYAEECIDIFYGE